MTAAVWRAPVTVLAGAWIGMWACRSDTSFFCQHDAECGPGGMCEDAGLCSVVDGMCPSGARYGEHAGALSGICVDRPAADAGDDDGVTSAFDDGNDAPSGDDGSDEVADESSADEATTTPPGGAFEQTDDALDGEFGSGTFDATAWQSDRVALTGATGRFTSRVFDASAQASWTDLAWTAAAPYGMPLPDGGATESNYAAGGIAMTDNVMLLHLDEGAVVDGGMVLDASGQGNHGSMHAPSGVGASVVGRFGEAFADGAMSWVGIANGGDFDFDNDDFTWSVWFLTSQACPGNAVYLGIDGQGTARAHLWLGCAQSGATGCGSGEVTVLSGTLRSDHAAADGVNFCGSTPIADGQWHHAAMVKRGHGNTTVDVFLDGALEASDSGGFDQPIDFPKGTEFGVGAFTTGSYQAWAYFDEAAVWRRALTTDEIVDLHRRGVQRLGFSIRTCEADDCADDPAWLGPDPDGSGRLVDPGPSPGVAVALPLAADARYFQYRADFEGEPSAASATTALFAVTVSGVR